MITRGVRPPTAALARSWLLVNAMRVVDFATALDSGADQIVLDLEDAVAPAGKDAAKGGAAAWLEKYSPGRGVWVRVNYRTSSFWAARPRTAARHPAPRGRHAGEDRPGRPGHRDVRPDERDRAGARPHRVRGRHQVSGRDRASARDVPPRVRLRRLPARHRDQRRRPGRGAAPTTRRRQPRRRPPRPRSTGRPSDPRVGSCGSGRSSRRVPRSHWEALVRPDAGPGAERSAQPRAGRHRLGVRLPRRVRRAWPRHPGRVCTYPASAGHDGLTGSRERSTSSRNRSEAAAVGDDRCRPRFRPFGRSAAGVRSRARDDGDDPEQRGEHADREGEAAGDEAGQGRAPADVHPVGLPQADEPEDDAEYRRTKLTNAKASPTIGMTIQTPSTMATMPSTIPAIAMPSEGGCTHSRIDHRLVAGICAGSIGRIHIPNRIGPRSAEQRPGSGSAAPAPFGALNWSGIRATVGDAPSRGAFIRCRA